MMKPIKAVAFVYAVNVTGYYLGLCSADLTNIITNGMIFI